MTGRGGRNVPPAEVNAAAFSHEQLKKWTDDADARAAQAFADEWTETGTALVDAAEALKRASLGSESGWTGEAAEAMRSRLGQISAWSGGTGSQVAAASQTVARQSEAADVARRAMPDPVSYDPAQMIRDAQAGGLIAMASLPQQLYAQKQKHDAAFEEAVRIVSDRDVLMSSAAQEVAMFEPPPSLDGNGAEDGTFVDSRDFGPAPGSDGGPTGGPGGSGGPGGTDTGGPRSSGPGGSGPGGVPSGAGPGSSGTNDDGANPTPSGNTPPTNTGPGFGSTEPGAFTPGDSVPGGTTPGTSGPGSTGQPTGQPGGGPGPGFIPGGGGFSGSGSGGSPLRGGTGGGTGGGLAGGPGGAGPGASGGPGAGSGTPGAGRGATAVPPVSPGPLGAEAAARAAAARGGAGMGGMPLANPGPRDDDAEHKRPEFLQEPDPDSIFDSDVLTAPSVIGGPDDE